VKFFTPLSIRSCLPLTLLCLVFSVEAAELVDQNQCNIELVVLGTAQDAGKPQISVHSDPRWADRNTVEDAASIAALDATTDKRYLFDASPDIKYQLYLLDQLDGATGFQLDGVFLTHGHIGHYLGLAHLGREAMGAKSIPVYAMPKMQNFLQTNGPWDQLLALNNIEIFPIKDQSTTKLSTHLSVTPFLVPHRAEYTETVGYRIEGVSKSAIYLPDIDSWQKWDESGVRLEDVVAKNDFLFLVATFYSGAELPGRDMSLIPHPTIKKTMQRLEKLPASMRAKIWFIHLNHSNPVHDEKSPEYSAVLSAGFNIAKTGTRLCLD